MAKAKAILKRRKSVQNTAKITRTMQLISTAKFNRAHGQVQGTKPYALKVAELAADLFKAAGGEFSHPLLEPRDKIEKVGLLVLSSNQGLCGGYNTNLIRLARDTRQQLINEGKQVSLYLVGKKASQYFKFLGIEPERRYTEFSDKVPFSEVESVADEFIRRFSLHELDEIRVVYTQFVSSARQRAVVETLIPLAMKKEESAPGGREINYIYEPDAPSILAEVLPLYMKVSLYRMFVEAVASEQIARMVAMKGATENADKLIKSLTRLYNRARQTQITTEISEIVGGAAAIE